MKNLKNPVSMLGRFWKKARRAGDDTSDYLFFATTDAKRSAHVRTVLIKSVSERGIGFVTNRTGEKLKHFRLNPKVEGCIAWPKLALQVRVAGSVVPMPKAELERLWRVRPREAQILYWLGLKQSGKIPSYAWLKRRIAALEKKWKDRPRLSKAPNYVGFCLKPEQIEFLHHSPTRLNLRESFRKTPTGWKLKILAP